MFDNILNMIFGGNRSKGGNNRNRCNTKFSYKLVPFEQAKTMIESGQVTLMDVRTPSEYDLMHINTAINMPVEEIEKRIFTYEQTAPIMVYCSSGARSKTAIQILNGLGYTNIYIWEYGALATFPYKNMLIYSENIKKGY
ncbi:MAG: rhodanese-like domain-containing protein [Clostridia bacterium]|nr:rhodanese-like domain-containing protein [Clostridia bacterium]